MQVYVIPFIQPKSAELITHTIKPLSLHTRVNESDLPKDDRYSLSLMLYVYAYLRFVLVGKRHVNLTVMLDQSMK